MITRLITISLLASCLALGGIGTASAHESVAWTGIEHWGWGDGGGWGWSGGRRDYHFGHDNFGDSPTVPELDPSALGGGIALLGAGLLAINERRRSRK
ncbi:MAG TPA: hypothetical protein VMF50_10375 [Candidatus Binataceae bacterium]|nr:hypothetical protein [Candidatus Binataceae bacterium]